MARDVVCGMEVDERQSEAQGLTSEYDEQTHYFLAPSCKQQFDRNLRRFTSQSAYQS